MPSKSSAVSRESRRLSRWKRSPNRISGAGLYAIWRRAIEVGADVILKATKVDGIYSADPIIDKHAKKYDKLKYIEVISRGLKVMDTTAISLCMDNHMPIVVFNLNVKGNIKRACLGEKVGTIVS